MQEEEEFTIPEMVDEMREGKLQRRQFIKQLTIMGVSAAGIGAIVAAAAASSLPALFSMRMEMVQSIISNSTISTWLINPREISKTYFMTIMNMPL